MSGLINFMNNPIGRAFRIALGVVIIVAALTSIDGTWRLPVAAVGLLPIALGFSGRCLIEAIPGARPARR